MGSSSDAPRSTKVWTKFSIQLATASSTRAQPLTSSNFQPSFSRKDVGLDAGDTVSSLSGFTAGCQQYFRVVEHVLKPGGPPDTALMLYDRFVSGFSEDKTS